jgi:hypothetical protein
MWRVLCCGFAGSISAGVVPSVTHQTLIRDSRPNVLVTTL